MEYLSIKNYKEETQQEVITTLSMVDIKILHNACVDILNDCPDMISYDEVRKKLSKIILAESKEDCKFVETIKNDNIMRERKESKELKAINKALVAYYEKHGGNCVINCSVFAFDEEDEVIDDSMWIVGYAPCVKVDHEEIGKIIEAGDFTESWY